MGLQILDSIPGERYRERMKNPNKLQRTAAAISVAGLGVFSAALLYEGVTSARTKVIEWIDEVAPNLETEHPVVVDAVIEASTVVEAPAVDGGLIATGSLAVALVAGGTSLTLYARNPGHNFEAE